MQTTERDSRTYNMSWLRIGNSISLSKLILLSRFDSRFAQFIIMSIYVNHRTLKEWLDVSPFILIRAALEKQR